jgi:hypothetical protein
MTTDFSTALNIAIEEYEKVDEALKTMLERSS